MYREDLGIFLAVISARRPQNVSKMTRLIGDATWYVASGEEEIYRKNGATSVKESGELCLSRNQALKDAWKWGVPCLQLSDDLTAIKLASLQQEKKIGTVISFSEMVNIFQYQSCKNSASLLGVAPTDNAFYWNPNHSVSFKNFIVGDCIFIAPCGLYFDENLSLKEDYDYTLQHLTQYGKTLRCNHLLLSFQHRTNAGGAVSYRSTEKEKQAIFYLKNKWPENIKDNARRENEILLKW